MGSKFALIIGNTEYTDPGLAQLTAPGKDAEDFAHVLKDREIGAFDEVNILLNQPEYVVREAIYDFFNQKKPDDLLVFYFSGHGVRDDLGALYLAVKNTNRIKLGATAVPSDYIRKVMDQSRSKRQVLILDCCNSGAFEQGTKAATGVSIGTAAAFESGYGRIILTASDSTQFAWEGDKVIGETNNSLFTHYLVEGLEGEADQDGDGRITVDELYDYAYEKVRLATPKQTPSKFSSKQQGEIVLRQNIEEIKPAPLPPDLMAATENTITFVREGAVKQLENLLKGRNRGLVRSAEEALKHIAAEDDSYRLRLLAAQILESIQQPQLEQKAIDESEEPDIQKATEERIAIKNVEAKRKAKEESECRAAQKAEEEGLKKQKDEQRRIAREKTKADLKAKEEASRLAAQKSEEKRVARESAERRITQIRAKLGELFAYMKVVWEKIAKYLQSIPTNQSRIYTLSALAIVAVAGFLFYQQLSNDSFYFSGASDGDITIYLYAGEETNITQDIGEGENWSPAFGAFGRLYFTSNRDGKAEIYELKSDGNVERKTHTPDQWESWSPTVDAFGRLYFTSNREDGKAEIYEFKRDAGVERLTYTPNPWESWSPAVAVFGRLFFTSNREDGKAEIYEFMRDGNARQYTHTPGLAESWSPVIRGQTMYFTSDREGDNRVYGLMPQATAMVLFESWTTRTIERRPTSEP